MLLGTSPHDHPNNSTRGQTPFGELVSFLVAEASANAGIAYSSLNNKGYCGGTLVPVV